MKKGHRTLRFHSKWIKKSNKISEFRGHWSRPACCCGQGEKGPHVLISLFSFSPFCSFSREKKISLFHHTLLFLGSSSFPLSLSQPLIWIPSVPKPLTSSHFSLYYLFYLRFIVLSQTKVVVYSDFFGGALVLFWGISSFLWFFLFMGFGLWFGFLVNGSFFFFFFLGCFRFRMS